MMDKYFYLKGCKGKQVFKWCEDGKVHMKFSSGLFSYCSEYNPIDYLEYVRYGDWVPCTEDGYKLSYTKRELEGKVLKAHKDGFFQSRGGIEGEKFCSKGQTYSFGYTGSDEIKVYSEVEGLHTWNLCLLGEYFYPVNKPKGKKRQSDNWKNSISKSKFERCVNNDCVEVQSGVWYDEQSRTFYRVIDEVYYAIHMGKIPNWESGTRTYYESFLRERDSREEALPHVLETCTLVDKELPVKSDGGKSSYYEIDAPQWFIDKVKTGSFMVEDLAEIMFDNDFNFTNVLKAQKRMFEMTKGGGKEGNTFEYDATKCKYYVDKQVEMFNR